MTALEAAIADLAGFLDGVAVPYMVIGGFANLFWGRTRMTDDVDVTVLVPEAEWPRFLGQLGRSYRLLAKDPLAFARETHVVPLETPTNVRIDLVLGVLPYEESAVRRAVSVPVAGREIRVCTAEDLILHKLASLRARDRDDIEGVVLRQRTGIDRGYLDPLVRDLSRALDRPDILEQYGECLRKAGLSEP